MKRSAILLFFLLPLLAVSQTCEEKIAIAKKTKAKGDYRLALRQFNAAAADCGAARSGEIEKQILDIYERIEGLKKEADRQAAIARQEKEKAVAAEAEAKRALEKADKLINAFYFYEGRFALALKRDNQGNNKFYFIDKNGDPVSKLGEYDKAETFDYSIGYAIVKNKGFDFLLDTFGNTYRVAFTPADVKPEVTALFLREVLLDSFPNEILKHTQLKVLILSGIHGNKKHLVLPTNINCLENLLDLHIAVNQLDSLPTQIGGLKNLIKLNLLGNNLTGLPSQIGELKNLRFLDLRNNHLRQLPSQIGGLKNLIRLDLGRNQLSELPPQIGELKKLTYLDLSYNQLNEISSQIVELENLIWLYLSENKLEQLPPQMEQLYNLKTLDISNNQLSQLPPQLWKLKNLNKLKIGSNKLTELPSQIGELKKLEILSLGGYVSFEDSNKNQLTNLPSQLWGLQKLKSLDISYNELTELPPQIGELNNLIYLNARDNKLTELPSQIGNLINLKSLDISNNQLTILPFQFWKLKSLEQLDLDWNNLKELPPQIGELKSLNRLSLNGNRLTQIPEQIGELKNLTVLLMWNTRLKQLPPEIGELKSLTELSIFGSLLSSLPLQIGELKNLEKLDLQNTYLNQKEQEIVRMLLPDCTIMFSTPFEIDHVRICDEITQEIEISETNLQKKDTSISTVGLASQYNTLAWYQLLTGRFTNTEHSVRRGLELDSTNLYLHTNLPPALLFQDNPAKEAEAIRLYAEWKDKDFGPQNLPKYKDAFLSDLQEFEAAGIIPPSRQAAVERVKKMLQE